tara:strand:- start:742 stop:1788 length:1047 start_codon:yes stop_codon:yes gene_type:complete
MTDKEIDANVLVAARDEYTHQLSYYLSPLVDEGFVSIYKDAQEQTRSKDPKKASVLRNFQIFCKAIPTWNDTLLNNESERIKKACPFLMDLLTAVFVSNVKILAAIKLKGNSKNIKIKIPTTNIFIHKIYTSCAKFFYYEPQYYHVHRSFHKNENNRKNRLAKINEKISSTISDMLPVQEVLEEYLTGGFDSSSEEEEDEEEDEEEEEEDDEESEEEEDDDEEEEENEEEEVTNNDTINNDDEQIEKVLNDIEKTEGVEGEEEGEEDDDEEEEDGDEKQIPLDDLAEKDITRLSSVTDQTIQPPIQQEPTVENTQDEPESNPFQNNFNIKKESTSSSVPQNTQKFSFL